MPSVLQGKLILDSGKLTGSYFDRTEILICRHDENGSFGLVLNRPVHRTLGSVMEESLPEDLSKTGFFLGGPVQPEALSFLQETESCSEYEILPRLNLTHSLASLKEEYSVGGTTPQLRAYAGYAGWNKGQLEDEMKMGSWHVHPATVLLVFDPKPESLWHRIMNDKGGIHQLVARFPGNPSLN